jgi:hypothetical protein
MRLPYLVSSPSVTSPPLTRDLLNRIKRLRRGVGDVKRFRHILILCRGATTNYLCTITLPEEWSGMPPLPAGTWSVRFPSAREGFLVYAFKRSSYTAVLTWEQLVYY